MSAIINQRPSSSATSIGEGIKPELIQKTESQIARITSIYLLTKEEGFVIISEDRTVKFFLKRDSGQFWPSIAEYMPHVPTKFVYDEELMCLLVGLVNGAVYDFEVSEDMNSMTKKRQWNAHTSSITGLFISNSAQMVFSCSKDKSIVWHCSETGYKVGSFVLEAQCTAMQFDVDSKFVFVGDYSGSVFVLRIVGNSAQLVSKLSAHTDLITDLAWDASRQLLFSASSDSLVIMWDIGGKKGNCYELSGHDSKLTCLALASQAAGFFWGVDIGGFWGLALRAIIEKGCPNKNVMSFIFVLSLRLQYSSLVA